MRLSRSRSSSRLLSSSCLLSSSLLLCSSFLRNFSSSCLISCSRLLISSNLLSSVLLLSSSFFASSLFFLSSFLLSSSFRSRLSLSALSLSRRFSAYFRSFLFSTLPPLSLTLSLLVPASLSLLSFFEGGSLLLLLCQLLHGSAWSLLESR